MKLTSEQLKQFDEEGYLFFPDYFSPEETQILKTSVPEVFAQRRPENVREKSGDVVRTAFAVHTYHPVFEALVHHPRFVEPAEQLLKDKTYIHQFKINGKAAFDGDVWQWHQDYGTWKADDAMPEPRPRGRSQSAAHRPDRRRQVRLDVPGADPAHAGRAPGGHRRPVARPRAQRTWRAWAGSRERTSAARSTMRCKRRQHASHRRLAGAGAPSRRSTSSSNAPATRSPRSTTAWKPSRTASTWST
jgi:hypothetical protein